jgi:hypothetical protein
MNLLMAEAKRVLPVRLTAFESAIDMHMVFRDHMRM